MVNTANSPSTSVWLVLAAKLLVLSSSIYYFSYVTADPDLWGHIKFGADHWGTGELPRTDPYSFTALGYRWINHEWLSEIIFYLIYRTFGSAGLLFGKLLIGLSLAGLLIKICGIRKRDPLVLVTVLILSSYVARKGFMIRPQLFSFLCFALIVYLFHLFFFQRKDRLFLLPLIMVVWVNLHGGFLMGWALILGLTGWKTLERLILRKEETQLGILWLWLLITSLFTLANPYGYRLLAFLYETLSQPRAISEWAPIGLLDFSYLRLKLMALLFLGVLILNIRKVAGWEAAAIGMIMVIAFKQQRHTPFFAIAAAPFLVHWLSVHLDELRHRFPKASLSRASMILLIVAFGILSIYQVSRGVQRYVVGKFNVIVDPEEYPIAAVRFLKANHVRGNILLPFTWGEYAIWHLYPDCRVSIDGRFRTAYPESVIQDHFIPLEHAAGWKGMIRKYPADIILAKQSRYFHEMIKKSNEWVYAYSDRTAIVFFRKNPRNADLIERLRRRALTVPKDPISVYFP